MKALYFFSARLPQLLDVVTDHPIPVAIAAGWSANMLERIEFDGFDVARFSIYYVKGDSQAGIHNPAAEDEAERLTGELCDFSGTYIFVYADDTLFPTLYL